MGIGEAFEFWKTGRIEPEVRPAARECISCSWSGEKSECVYLGSIGPLCPECGDVTEEMPVDA